ncbi:MAG: hypothetical protein AAB320_07685 [Elusimicrobiota bacterium]
MRTTLIKKGLNHVEQRGNPLDLVDEDEGRSVKDRKLPTQTTGIF